MKNLCLGLAVALTLTACSKETETTTTTTTAPETITSSASEAKQESAAAETLPAGMPAAENSEELAAKAKANPLTRVVLSASHYDFGKIKKGEKVEHTYEISNTGDKPLIITAVKPACGCTAPTYSKDPIMPGQKGNVTLSFDPTNFSGIVNKSAEVFANVDRTPIMLTFSANIEEAK